MTLTTDYALDKRVFTLYRFYDREDALLYIGLTINPGRRMEKHRATKPWWSDVARIEMEQHLDAASLANAERAAIVAERPLHNIRMNGGGATITGAASVVAPDGLVGRWFHSWEPLADGDDGENSSYVRDGKRVKWQGQIIDRADDDYLVQTYSWWDGTEFGGALLVTRQQMSDWTFYLDSEHMQITMGCAEHYGGRRGRCRNPVTHVIRDLCGMGPVYRCWRCIEHYSGKVEEL